MATPLARSTLHTQLRRVGAAWLFQEERMTVVAEEVGLGGGRWADVVGLRSGKRVQPHTPAARLAHPYLTAAERRGKEARAVEIPQTPECRILEVKASRADFLAGVRKGQISNEAGGLGSYAEYVYLLCPWGVIRPQELPERWGLLWWWSGKVQYLYWCAQEHGEDQPHRRKRALIKEHEAASYVEHVLGAPGYHLKVMPSRGRKGFKWRGDTERQRLLRASSARKLTPSNPLSARAELLHSNMVEALLWRLYGERASSLPMLPPYTGEDDIEPDLPDEAQVSDLADAQIESRDELPSTTPTEDV